ncbi:ABC-type Fe3+-hydroxamate transport system substrate-binding protein [Alkalicoccobacillus murimartini]|uniref:ABC-type Fe3+-hydroxamate transport system substrate-binding protein n=2 Tax=Alkalicoccobacillus murimartini TaxID=171685 RepID=A0ABT9YM63_9BACI|nr:ABC-type Fe3+-hydroxamate transport system substrate-binding protein [Alkalicoccobacillus murimartini]
MEVKGESNSFLPIEYSVVLFTCIEISKKEGQWLTHSHLFPQTGKLILHSQDHVRPLLSNLFNHSTYDKEVIKQSLVLFLQKVRQGEDNHKNVVPLEETIDYMSNHFMDNLKISTLASSSGLSLNHFTKRFKQIMNTTPSEYLIEKRIHRAKELLFSTQKTKQIAYQLGFQDEHYFSRVFKKREGIAPTFFIKNKCQRIASMYYGLDDHLLTLGLESVSSLSYSSRVRGTLIPHHQFGLPIDSMEPNYEELQRMQPDYILTSDRYQPSFELTHIAPVAVVHHTNQFQDVLHHLADIFGREHQANQWEMVFQERKEALKNLLKKSLGEQSVCFIRVGPKGYRVYGKSSQVGHLLYHDLGLTSSLPDKQDTIDLLIDELYSFVADYVFIMVDPNVESNQKMLELMQTETWNELEAVQKKRIFEAHDLLFQPLGPKGYLHSMEFVAEKLMGSERKKNLSIKIK